jgi:hypothetical protein
VLKRMAFTYRTLFPAPRPPPFATPRRNPFRTTIYLPKSSDYILTKHPKCVSSVLPNLAKIRCVDCGSQ